MTRQKISLVSLLFHWLPFASLATILCGLIYLSGQQILRQAANDPQIQLAEDTATALSNGSSLPSFAATQQIDMKNSLAPYIIIYNHAGQALFSTAKLDNQTPQMPQGVFAYVSSHGEDRLTWQPQSGVRSAVVVTVYNGKQSGFVVAGRSLREVEKREDQLEAEVVLAWLASLGVTFFFAAISSRV